MLTALASYAMPHYIRPFDMRHLALLLVAALLFSCDKLDEERQRVDLPPLDLTFIIYMVGDNNLSSNIESNLIAIETGMGRMSHSINVVALVDRAELPPQLLSLQHDGYGGVERQVLREYDETNVLDTAFMAGVLREAAELCPSSHYVLDLWSHGMGWLPAELPFYPTHRWFGQDSSAYMDIKDLAKVLQSSGLHYDFLMFDACLMATVEVAYELRHAADCIVASPIEVWEMGFPYATIMPSLERDDRAVAVAEAYAAYYDGEYDSNYGIKMTGAISVIDCAAMEHLAEVVRTQLESLAPSYDESIVRDIMRYDRHTNHYLYDFGDYMTKLLGEEGAAPVKEALDGTFRYRYSTPTFGTESSKLDLDPSRYTGIGSYVPRMSYTGWNAYYKTLQWFEDTEHLPIY